MIVIVEGFERSGKTTICKEFVKNGFTYFKDFLHYCNVNGSSMAGRMDSLMNVFTTLPSNYNIVVDRYYLTAIIYGEERGDSQEQIGISKMVDKILSLIPDTTLILAQREFNYIDIVNLKGFKVKRTFDKVKEIQNRFEYEFEKSEIKEKYKIDISKYDSKELSNLITKIANSKKYDFYLASPFFTFEQQKRLEKVAKVLRDNNYSVYLPSEHSIVKLDSDSDFVKKVFDSNVDAINNSKAVLAITDEKDMGTIWEAGYAYGKGIPVIYYAETLGLNPFNIMLSESAKGIYTDINELKTSAKKGTFENKAEVLHE